MAKTYQTEIMIFHGKVDEDVRFTRRSQTGKYTERTYRPTKASWQRLERTVSQWSKRGWANIMLVGRGIFVEPTV